MLMNIRKQSRRSCPGHHKELEVVKNQLLPIFFLSPSPNFGHIWPYFSKTNKKVCHLEHCLFLKSLVTFFRCFIKKTCHSISDCLINLTRLSNLLDKPKMTMDNAEPSLFLGKLEWGLMPCFYI